MASADGVWNSAVGDDVARARKPAVTGTSCCTHARVAVDRYVDASLINDVGVTYCPPGVDPGKFAGPDAPPPCTPPGAAATVEAAIRRTGLVIAPALDRQLFLGVRDARDATDGGKGEWWSLGAYGTTTTGRRASQLRPIVVEGALPSPSSTTDVVIGENLAKAAHLHAGDWMTVASWKRSEWPLVISTAKLPTTPERRLRVAAVVRGYGELVGAEGVIGRYLGDELVTLGQGVQDRYFDEFLSFWGEVFQGRLVDGATPESLTSALTKELPGWTVSADPRSPDFDALRRVVRTERNGTWIVAASAALAALVFLAFSTSRQIQREFEPWPTMANLGLTRRDLLAAALVRASTLVVPAALLGVLVALLLGRVPPFGTTRRMLFAQPSRLDVVVLLGCAGLVALGAVVGALIGARRVVAASAAVRAGSTRHRPVVSVGGPVAAIASMWAGSRVRTVTPIVLGVGALAASATLSATAQGLQREPRRVGAWWDVSGGEFWADPSTFAPAAAKVRSNPDVVDAAGFLGQTVRIGDVSAGVLAFPIVKGSPRIPALSGRAPRSADEIAVGPRTLRRLGRRVGDTVTVTQSERPPETTKTFRIVGTVHLLEAMFQADTAEGLLTEAGFQRLGLPTDIGMGTMVMTLRDGVSLDEARASLGLPFGPTLHVPQAARPVRDILRLHPLGRLIAALIGALTFVAFAHAVVTATARRRAEHGILAMLGMTRRQLRGGATLAWAVVGFVGGVVGVVVGVLLERPIERGFERTLGLDAATVRPPAPLSLILAGALALAALLGYVAVANARHDVSLSDTS